MLDQVSFMSQSYEFNVKIAAGRCIPVPACATIICFIYFFCPFLIVFDRSTCIINDKYTCFYMFQLFELAHHIVISYFFFVVVRSSVFNDFCS